MCLNTVRSLVSSGAAYGIPDLGPALTTSKNEKCVAIAPLHLWVMASEYTCRQGGALFLESQSFGFGGAATGKAQPSVTTTLDAFSANPKTRLVGRIALLMIDCRFALANSSCGTL